MLFLFIELTYYGMNFPLSLRETIRPSKYKSELVEHLWNYDIESDHDNSIADVFEDYSDYYSESASSDHG